MKIEILNPEENKALTYREKTTARFYNCGSDCIVIAAVDKASDKAGDDIRT